MSKHGQQKFINLLSDIKQRVHLNIKAKIFIRLITDNNLFKFRNLSINI